MISPRPTPRRASTPFKRDISRPPRERCSYACPTLEAPNAPAFYHGNDDDSYLLLAMGPFFFSFFSFLFKGTEQWDLISMETGHGNAHLRPYVMMHPRRHICSLSGGTKCITV